MSAGQRSPGERVLAEALLCRLEALLLHWQGVLMLVKAVKDMVVLLSQNLVTELGQSADILLPYPLPPPYHFYLETLGESVPSDSLYSGVVISSHSCQLSPYDA